MFKRIVTVLLAVIMCFSLFAVTVSASETATFDISSASKTSLLTFSGTTASGKSIYNDTETVASVVITQTFQKKGTLWFWSSVGDDVERTYFNIANVALTSTKPGLSSGKYRLKTKFTVTLADGTTKSDVVYSSEVEL